MPRWSSSGGSGPTCAGAERPAPRADLAHGIAVAQDTAPGEDEEHLVLQLVVMEGAHGVALGDAGVGDAEAASLRAHRWGEWLVEAAPVLARAAIDLFDLVEVDDVRWNVAHGAMLPRRVAFAARNLNT